MSESILVQFPDLDLTNSTGIMAAIAFARQYSNSNPKDAFALAKVILERATALGDDTIELEAASSCIARAFRVTTPSERKILVEQWRDRIMKDGTLLQRVGFINSQAVDLMDRGKPAQALTELQALYQDIHTLDNDRMRVVIYTNLGNAHMELSIFDSAVKWFYEALQIAEKMNDMQSITMIRNNLGIIHLRLNEYDLAVEKLGSVLEYSEATNNHLLTVQCLNNLTDAYFHKGDYERAKTLSLKAIEIEEIHSNYRGMVNSTNNLGAVYRQIGELDLAEQAFHKELQIATECGFESNQAMAKLNLGYIYISREQFETALDWVSQAQSLAKEIGAKEIIEHTMRAIAEIYKNTNRWEEGFQLQEEIFKLHEETLHGKQRIIVEEMRVRYESERKEMEAQMYRERNDALENEILRRTEVEDELRSTVTQLNSALEQIKTLKGIIPICCVCKNIRDDKGYWNQVEIYVSQHTQAEFSHGMCPDCAKKLYPEFSKFITPETPQ